MTGERCTHPVRSALTEGGLRPHPEVIVTDLEDELVLLDPRSQEMFSLNRTGRLVWQALPARSIDGLIAAVAPTLPVDRARAAADVRALVRELQDADLVLGAAPA
jgi:hypothetical protein